MEAASTKKAVIHFSTVACFVVWVDVGFAVVVMFLELYSIVAINNLFDAVYTVLAGVSVEYLPKIVACWEKVFDKVEEFFANVSIYNF